MVCWRCRREQAVSCSPRSMHTGTDVDALIVCLWLCVCLVSQDDAGREGNARASENTPKEQVKRAGDAAASGGVVTGLGGALPTVPPLPHTLPHIPPPALPGSRAWVEHAAYTQREGAQNAPAANGERTGDIARDARVGDCEIRSGSELPATRPAIAFRLGAAAPNAPSKGGSTDGVAIRGFDAGRAESGCQGEAGAAVWSGWREDGEEQQAGAGDVAAADGGGSVGPGGEGQGRASVESGEEIQRKLREQALKSMLLARAKGSSAGDRCAAHLLRNSPSTLHALSPFTNLSGVPRHSLRLVLVCARAAHPGLHFVLSSLSGRRIKHKNIIKSK